MSGRRVGAMLAAAIVLTACGDGKGIVEEPKVAAPQAEVVTFSAADGVELSGFAFGAGQTAVVMAHGQGGAKEEWTDVAVALAEDGVVAFPFDLRGYAGQAGARDTKAATDVAAAVQAMRDRGATKVFVVGASTGGTAALAVAAREELAGVVSVSGPATFKGANAAKAAKDIDEPTLFAVAADDKPFAEAARALAKATGGRVETFAGAAHGSALLAEHGDQLTQLIVGFVQNPGAQAPPAP